MPARPLLVFLFICIIPAAFSQSKQAISIKEVPVSVQRSFITRFPAKNSTTGLRDSVQWMKLSGSYRCRFRQDGKINEATFDPSGLLGESTQEISRRELPAVYLPALEAYEKKKGGATRSLVKHISSAGKVSYGPSGSANILTLTNGSKPAGSK